MVAFSSRSLLDMASCPIGHEIIFQYWNLTKKLKVLKKRWFSDD